MSASITLGDLLGSSLEEEFAKFDLTEIQTVLDQLADTEAIDLAHAELLQQQALRGADIICVYLGKLVKTVGYLEAKVNSTKNKIALNFKPADGGKATIDLRKFASEASPEVETVQMALACAKASKIVLEKKYDILIRSHHHWKEISTGLRRTVLGFTHTVKEKNTVDGWE